MSHGSSRNPEKQATKAVFLLKLIHSLRPVELKLSNSQNDLPRAQQIMENFQSHINTILATLGKYFIGEEKLREIVTRVISEKHCNGFGDDSTILDRIFLNYYGEYDKVSLTNINKDFRYVCDSRPVRFEISSDDGESWIEFNSCISKIAEFVSNYFRAQVADELQRKFATDNEINKVVMDDTFRQTYNENFDKLSSEMFRRRLALDAIVKEIESRYKNHRPS